MFNDSKKEYLTIRVEIPTLALEKAEIDPMSVTEGYFTFDNKKYEIVSCVPKGLFSGIYSTYEYNCSEVGIL